MSVSRGLGLENADSNWPSQPRLPINHSLGDVQRNHGKLCTDSGTRRTQQQRSSVTIGTWLNRSVLRTDRPLPQLQHDQTTPSLPPLLLHSSLLRNHILRALQPERNHVQKQRSLEADAKVTLRCHQSPQLGPHRPRKAASALEKCSSNGCPIGGGLAPCGTCPLGCCVKTSSLGALQQHAKRSCKWTRRQNRCRSHVGTFQNDAWIGLEQSRGPRPNGKWTQAADARTKLSHTKVTRSPQQERRGRSGEAAASVQERSPCSRYPQRLNSDKFMKTGSTRDELFPWPDPIKLDVTCQAHEENWCA